MAETGYHDPLLPARTSRRPTEAELPYEDGEPLAESDYQLKPLNGTYDVLVTHHEHRPDVAVHADMMIHYESRDEHGNVVRRSIAPDVFVAFGAPKRNRYSYVCWDEPAGPSFVLEILSPSTWQRDVGEKKEIYAELDVTEYWQFDPLDRYLDAPLVGCRLAAGKYQRIPPINASRPDGPYPSEVLGLELRAERGLLRFRDPATGEDLKMHGELDQAYRQLDQEHRKLDREHRQLDQAHRQLSEAHRAEAAARAAAELRAKDAEARAAELAALLRRRS